VLELVGVPELTLLAVVVLHLRIVDVAIDAVERLPLDRVVLTMPVVLSTATRYQYLIVVVSVPMLGADWLNPLDVQVLWALDVDQRVFNDDILNNDWQVSILTGTFDHFLDELLFKIEGLLGSSGSLVCNLLSHDGHLL